MRLSILVLITASSLMISCATRTKYHPHNESGGYSSRMVDDKIAVARFAGNAYTHRSDAEVFSVLRAIEMCDEAGFKAAKFYDIVDLSTQQTVQRSSNYTYKTPTQFNGTANSNTNFNYFGNGMGQANTSTNLSGTVSGGNEITSSRSWEETYHYPTFDTYFSCVNETYVTNIGLNPVSAEEMKPLVKDLMGALQVKEIGPGTPNEGILEVGDIILKVNGKRVQLQNEYSAALDTAKDKSKISMTILRDGKQLNVFAKAVDGMKRYEDIAAVALASACAVPEVGKRPVCTKRVRNPAQQK